MTDDERQILISAKESVSARLAGEDLLSYRLSSVDPRLYSYVKSVCKDSAGHNLYEQLAVERFLKMCHRYGLNAGVVKAFFAFYERLSFPGIKGHQCYELTPVQTFQFASIFGFWEDGRRVVKEATLFVPRKFSKTTSSAAFAVWDVLFGDANAESYIGANSQDQAKKCFDVIRGCFRRLDPNGKRYTVNEQVIKSRRRDRSAFAQCLTANARTKDGLNASTVIMDEFSQAKDNTLLTVLTTSMGARLNPLTVIITTASDVFDGPFYEMLQGYKRLLLGEFEDDTVFAHLFLPDLDDDESSPATWRKVHPHMGVTVSEEFYRREYEKAKRNGASDMLAFRTKLMNIYSENERAAWIGGVLARSMMRHMTIEGTQGRPFAEVAIDLSESDDFSAISVGWFARREKRYCFLTHYFFPEGALPGHRNEQLYRAWASAGHMTLLPGDVIDYQSIVAYVLRLGKYFTLHGVGYDPYRSQEVVNSLASAGLAGILRPVRQTHGEFMAPVEWFEHGAKTDRIRINDNPINAFCFANAVLQEDNLGNKKPYKRQQHLKIDGAITMLMCSRMIIDANAIQKK